MEPAFALKRVQTKQDFIQFLEALLEHRREADALARRAPPEGFDVGPGGWENWTVEEFLEAMHGYAVDSALPDAPTWHDVGRLLLAGKGYE
jgi:hypothetical protein